MNNSKEIQPMVHPRLLHTLVSYQRQTYVLGGQADSNTYLQACERWDEKAWIPIPDMNRPRSAHAAFATQHGIFVAGGFSASGAIENSIERYAGQNWELLELATTWLAGSVAIGKNSNEVLILGGSDGEGPSRRVICFDSSNNSSHVEELELLKPRVRPIVFKSGFKICVMGGGQSGG